MLEFLIKNVAVDVTGEELYYVASISEWARRVRELRTEFGWPVKTKFTGRPDLKPGVYVLESNRQAPMHDQRIPDPVRVNVLKRDGFKCVECGWSREQMTADDPRQLLELHHKIAHAEGGENEAGNLITLCNVCHDAVHRETGRPSGSTIK